MVYLDELIVLHIVQSVWSIATSYNRGVGQDISTTSPALKFKLENRFREEKTVSAADYLPWGYYNSRPTCLFLLCMTQSDIAEWIHYMKTAWKFSQNSGGNNTELSTFQEGVLNLHLISWKLSMVQVVQYSIKHSWRCHKSMWGFALLQSNALSCHTTLQID